MSLLDRYIVIPDLKRGGVFMGIGEHRLVGYSGFESGGVFMGIGERRHVCDMFLSFPLGFFQEVSEIFVREGL